MKPIDLVRQLKYKEPTLTIGIGEIDISNSIYTGPAHIMLAAMFGELQQDAHMIRYRFFKCFGPMVERKPHAR